MPISKQTKPETIIKDFEKSDDPKFAGDSDEKRKKRALAAYYRLHPEKSKKMHEDVQSFINYASNGDKESAIAAVQEILMDKVAARLETMKSDIAQETFGFGEARKFDDEEGYQDKDDKKKGEEVRKARRAKAQGKYQKPEIEESVESLEESALTKKHMIAAAKEVATHADPQIRQTLHDHHAKIFAASNPRFDAAKFKAACNL